MIETAIIMSMLTASALLAYMAFQVKDQHAQIRMLLSSVALFFVIGTVFTGYMFALEGYPGVAGYMIYFVLALISVTTVYIFYLIYLYFKSTTLIASGTHETFENEEL